MKRLPFFPHWLLASLLLLLVLSACERPIPGSDPVDVPDVIQPTNAPIQIPTAIPTPVAPDAEPTTGPDAAAQPEPVDSGGGESEPAGEATTTDAPADSTSGDTAAPTEPVATELVHTVQAGDTLSQLAEFYNVPVEEIAAANGITDLDTLSAGQELIIPAAGTVDTTTTTVPSSGGELTHTVRAGENLFRIGLAYGFTIEELASYNGITDPARIEVGQVLRIPPSD